ncbi:uncharacterized protein LOC123544428 [Mercenaria mercenaria]|uniref:uncharacterized protein LOC123544428 n=1 Tax=Mercenaria mercenaria TaxID=6596 RepID=UPI00234E5A3F|nr:uncharacterized protein LOC123544428 [Mercenaria mercenaria]
MKMLVKIVLLVALCAFVNSTEPECSRFHYEEKTLEKMIKTEIYVDKIKSETEHMQQKMSEKMDGIQEDWKKTQLELKEANEDNEKAVEEIKNKVESLSTVQAVAFLAHNIKNKGPSDGETIVFSTTHFDVGSGYNNKNGTYTTPVAGIYMFTLQLCITGRRYIYFEIDTENGPILKGCFNDDSGSYDGCQTATTIAELGAKERVWIKSGSSSSGTDFWTQSTVWNSFSGVLISTVTK